MGSSQKVLVREQQQSRFFFKNVFVSEKQNRVTKLRIKLVFLRIRVKNNSSSGQSKITNFFSGPFRTEHPRQPSAAAAAAINRQSGRGSTPGRPLLAPSNPDAGMSEDEALAAALAASMADSSLQNS